MVRFWCGLKEVLTEHPLSEERCAVSWLSGVGWPQEGTQMHSYKCFFNAFSMFFHWLAGAFHQLSGKLKQKGNIQPQIP